MTNELNPNQPFLDALETELSLLTGFMIRVHEHECLACYVFRMTEQFGCRGPRFLGEFRNQTARRATALLDRMRARGAGCDCELFMNVLELRPEHLGPTRQFPLYNAPGVLSVVDRAYPEQLPACLGVRRGSTQPCDNWRRIRYPRW